MQLSNDLNIFLSCVDKALRVLKLLYANLLTRQVTINAGINIAKASLKHFSHRLPVRVPAVITGASVAFSVIPEKM
jgi:hypothetical protein